MIDDKAPDEDEEWFDRSCKLADELRDTHWLDWHECVGRRFRGLAAEMIGADVEQNSHGDDLLHGIYYAGWRGGVGRAAKVLGISSQRLIGMIEDEYEGFSKPTIWQRIKGWFQKDPQ